ncbi:hypothetical protein R1sor_014966 [Riccia sorocarpa]|uniref:Fungal N-terminal domain-containing protein n=1 Tax=Riccia sorocarpa TaxID=122646 RepID=A0ABD3HDI0_9MARC
MDPVLSILGLVETLVGTMDFIISKARQVYHLKSKCEAFANLLDELLRTLRNATLESIANEQAVQRLNKLNETLTRAGFLLTDLEKPMKWNFAVATGKADRKLDALHKEIMESLTLLNTHVLHGAPSPSQVPRTNF